MTTRMLEAAARTGRVLEHLLNAGLRIGVRRRGTRVELSVAAPGAAPQWYDGGTLDACTEQIDLPGLRSQVEHLPHASAEVSR